MQEHDNTKSGHAVMKYTFFSQKIRLENPAHLRLYRNYRYSLIYFYSYTYQEQDLKMKE